MMVVGGKETVSQIDQRASTRTEETKVKETEDLGPSLVRLVVA